MRFLDTDKLQIGFKFITPFSREAAAQSDVFDTVKIANTDMLITKKQENFKGFLDKSEITMQYEMATLAYAGQGSISSVPYRIVKNYNLDFSVYSEHLDEAIVNYRKLHTLISYLAVNPSSQSGGTFNVLVSNNTIASLRVNFSANPLLYSDNPADNNYDVLVTKFSYSVIDDHGYVLYPFTKNGNSRPTQSNNYSNEVMIPLAYKVSIGSVINPSVETAKQAESSGAVQTNPLPVASTQVIDDVQKDKVRAILKDYNKKLIEYIINRLPTSYSVTNGMIIGGGLEDTRYEKIAKELINAANNLKILPAFQ